MTEIHRHVLPGEAGGDIAWYTRQSPFEQAEVQRQVAFKRRHWPDLPDGTHSKHPTHTYPHILPIGSERQAFYELLADPILQYLNREGIALHTEARNLKSSQVACLNILFPLSQDLTLATLVLRPILPELRELTAVEFEYTGPPESTTWLGESKRGKRGQNRTSIDAALFWTDLSGNRCATLIEWKYTERRFGACSAFAGANASGRQVCRSLDLVNDPHPGRRCHLTRGGDLRSRHYWDHLALAGIRAAAFSGIEGCPFSGPFFQLMRQFLLAAYLRAHKLADHVEVVVLAFGANDALRDVPPNLLTLGPDPSADILAAWNSTLGGVPPIRHISVETLVAAVDAAPGVDLQWRAYLRERYGL